MKILLPNTKRTEYMIQQIIRRYIASDLAEVVQRAANVDGEQVAREAGVEAVQDFCECLGGFAQRCMVTGVGDNGFAAVHLPQVNGIAQRLLELFDARALLGRYFQKGCFASKVFVEYSFVEMNIIRFVG